MCSTKDARSSDGIRGAIYQDCTPAVAVNAFIYPDSHILVNVRAGGFNAGDWHLQEARIPAQGTTGISNPLTRHG